MKSGWPPELYPFLHDILCVLAEPKANGLWVNDYTWTWDEDTRIAQAVGTWKKYGEQTWGVEAYVDNAGDCKVHVCTVYPELKVVLAFIIEAGSGLRDDGRTRRTTITNRLMDIVLKEVA